jgi:hypothetical protein
MRVGRREGGKEGREGEGGGRKEGRGWRKESLSKFKYLYFV